jgi:RHS repeat-associated protein
MFGTYLTPSVSIQATNSFINVQGVMNNTGRAYVLGGTGNTWAIQAGTIQNGVVSSASGQMLTPIGGSSVLNNVTMNADVDMSHDGDKGLNIVGDLTLNGTIHLGGLSGGNGGYGGLDFSTASTVLGTGTIAFGDLRGPQSYAHNTIGAAANSTLTIGPGITITGTGNIQGGNSASQFVNQGTIRVDAGKSLVLAVNNWGNSGTILQRGDITFVGASVNSGLIEKSGGSTNWGGTLSSTGTLRVTNGASVAVPLIANQGIVQSQNGAVLTLSSPGPLANPSALQASGGAEIVVDGNLTGDTRNSSLFSLNGVATFTGGTNVSPRLIEAMSRDKGVDSTGFTNNFAYSSLALADGAYARLTDQADNSVGPGSEAVYVGSISVPAGATLDLNGLHLYSRAASISGQVVNGSITSIPDSGAITFNLPVVGQIGAVGEVDEWSFLGYAGRTLSVVVNPGASQPDAPLAPRLDWAEVQLLNASNQVLASATSAASGAITQITNFALAATGVYKVRVLAAAGHSSSTGNYSIGVWDVTTDQLNLNFNQQANGAIETPYAIDRWNFSASAGQQIRFDLLNASSSAIRFTLTGPSGYTAFSNLTADSSLITLPTSGNYGLIVDAATGYTGNYAFRLDETTLTNLSLGVAYSGATPGSGSAQLFKVHLSNATALKVVLDDLASTNRNDLYVKLGAPPTRTDYQFRSTAVGADQNVLVPLAAAGDWYILLYGESTPNPGPFTLVAVDGTLFVNRVTPDAGAVNADLSLTLTGSGFDALTTVTLVAANNSIVAATTTHIDLNTQITATFAAGTVPAGTYSVRVQKPGGISATLPNAVNVAPAGSPKFESRLVMPAALGRHATATIWIEYGNSGNVAMPAPLLVLRSSDPDGSDKPLLMLDRTRLVENFWASSKTDEVSNSILLLASGATPGVLQPGETIRVPVAYLGLEQPWDFGDSAIEMEIRYWTVDDPTPIDWAARKEQLRPTTLSSEVWSPIYDNLTSSLTTTGAYVRMLDENASYLGRLGENVIDVDYLWSFEIQQAFGYTAVPYLASSVDASMPSIGPTLDFARRFGSTIQSRYEMGFFGRGWFTPWQTKLDVKDSGGSVRIYGIAGSQRDYIQDSRSLDYHSEAGDSSALRNVSAGVYELRDSDGTITRFRADGKIAYVEDPNGNRTTASYDGAGRLIGLANGNGNSIAIGYNAAGRVNVVADSAGRATTYAYDGANEHLLAVTTADGKVTQYTYADAAQGAARVHALTSVAADGTTRSFVYDARGRLDATYLTGNSQFIDLAYDSAGTVTYADAAGVTSLYFDHRGLLAKVTDPLGNSTTAQYDANLRLSTLVAPTGESQSFTWCSCGNMTSFTDELGHTTTFSYDNPFKRLTSFVDANGNVTQYSYDADGNLLATTYANGSSESYGNYTGAGLPQSYTNRRGQVTAYEYFASGQIKKKIYADGSYDNFTYDARGNLLTATETSAANVSETTTYEYDYATDGDRLTKVAYPTGRYLEYQYDAFGRRSSLTDQDGYATHYEYDAAGQLYRLRDETNAILVTYLYDAAGRLSRVDKGNGTFTTYEYDAAGQLLHLINYKDASTVNSRFDYTYDSRDRRTSMTILEGTWTYMYDGAGQLLRAVFASANASVITNQDLKYEYDAAGNRIRTIINGVTTNYQSNTLNQYTQVGSTVYQYDADGSLTFDGENTYAYDQRSRLIRVSGPSGVTEYEYDSFGNRIATTVNGAREEYLLDPTGIVEVIAEYRVTSGTQSHYAYGLGLAHGITSGASHYFEFDALGSVVGITSNSAVKLNAYSYLPFGERLFSTESVLNDFEFIGQYGVTREASGDSFMRARFYDSNLGRFASMDPIGLGGGLNFYAYAFNQPTSLIDPTGLCSQSTNNPKPMPTPPPQPSDVITNQPTPITGSGRRFELAEVDVITTQPTPIVGGKRYGISLAGFAGFYSPNFVPSRTSSRAGLAGAGGGSAGLTCESPPDGNGGEGGEPGEPGGEGDGPSPSAIDPNEKFGAAGFGAPSFIPGQTTIPYRIDFENLGPGSTPAPTQPATAPAQRVEITDQLPANLDWSTLRFTEAGFGDVIITVSTDSTYFAQTTSMTYNGQTFDVLVELRFDPLTGKLRAIFQSLDPNTSLPPDVLIGFLPPEDGTGRGKGHIVYTVRTAAGLPTGTEIRNVALISFDYQTLISTNQVNPQNPLAGTDPAKEALNTIDAGTPTSAVAALPALSNAASFNVSWSGADDAGGSGIHSYDVYVSTNGSAYALWQHDVTATSASFTGVFNNRYAFYSVASDNVGHEEATPGVADATVEVVKAGDYDRNLFVDGADFLLWQRQLGSSAAPAGTGADGNASGSVEANDLALWKSNYGSSAGAALTTSALAPTSTTVAASSTLSVSASVDEALFATFANLTSLNLDLQLQSISMPQTTLNTDQAIAVLLGPATTGNLRIQRQYVPARRRDLSEKTLGDLTLTRSITNHDEAEGDFADAANDWSSLEEQALDAAFADSAT